MATQPVAEANQQLWDETLTRLLNLSSVTVRRNADLENRVAELELELSVWKQAHSVALEASEREVKAHNVQMAALNRQMSNMDSFKTVTCTQNQNALILCIINGDELFFNQELLIQGYAGGRAAAQQLTQVIAEQLTNEEAHVYGRLSFWITIYLNKTDLAEDLVANNICSQEQFHAFLIGFTQASPRFTTVDIGQSKDALEAKIKEYIQIFTCFPQTLRLFFGGYDSMAYMPTLSALERDQMLGKIVILHPLQDTQEGNSTRPNVFSLPRLAVDGLFLAEKLPRGVSRKLAPLATPSYSSVTSNGGLISPQSPARSTGRPVDPSLPLHKQNPPPCNEFYLMTCSKGAGICKYSHEYILSPDQLVSLANNAKKAPCNWLKNGVQCPYGDQCCWGHVCPNGPKCFHLSKGKCWFKGGTLCRLPHHNNISNSCYL
ncbi:hypothetical protein HYPSUDRAFT_125737 [Hypholoma sublateritium FD-334 SS-4]|uniref:C3H1-type domain-containing protein n=1 Tax=Hypholoma sublateritium (strain FD-334 SS-4) TaxID=945553 RepID=A0A0D2LPL7_HYPSF|nr:hypothetical protein HYPSUDRAFT_125737 [Hypholoma sublateritium FD-334 SS-4]